MPIDNALPFLFQARESGLIGRLTVVFFDPNMRAIIAENPAIDEALRRLGADIRSLPETDSGRGRIVQALSYLKTLWILRAFFRGRILALGGPLRGFVSKIVGMNKRWFGGRHLDFRLVPYSYDTLRFFSGLMQARYGRRPYTMKLTPCDAVLSSFGRDEFLSFGQLSGSQSVRIIKVGYARGFPAWHSYISDTAGSHLEPNIRRPFLFWPLSVLHRQEANGEHIDLRPHMRATLRILKEYEGRLQTVFRFHPTTDREVLRALIHETGFQDYTISNAHPHQLISEASMIFSNSGSSLFCDAYFMGCPVVQFVTRDPMYACVDDTGASIASLYKPDVDHFIVDDANKFRDVLADILLKGRGAVTRRRSEIRRRFHVPSNEELRQALSGFV